jgi:hypothetical protein
MIDRVDERLGLYPERLAGDAAYGSAEMLDWLVHERGIEPHIPVFDKSKRADDTFSRADFTYDHEADVYRCPGSNMLTTTGTIVNDNQLLYRASKYDCQACALKPRCCPKEPARKVPRSIHEGARDMARDIAKTEAYAVSRRQRKKGGDAVRPSQADPASRSAEAPRTHGRPRRVPARRHRPEPAEIGQADPHPDSYPRHLSDPRHSSSLPVTSMSPAFATLRPRLLQRNRSKRRNASIVSSPTINLSFGPMFMSAML